MKSKEEFKERFSNGEFDALLKDISSPKDVVRIANDLGYELDEADVLSVELNDDQLLNVAGGKNDNTTQVYYVDTSTKINGDNNKQVVL